MREEVTLGWRNRLSIGVNQAELEMIIPCQSSSRLSFFVRLVARSAIRSLPSFLAAAKKTPFPRFPPVVMWCSFDCIRNIAITQSTDMESRNERG
jgi:hypothetical protein